MFCSLTFQVKEDHDLFLATSQVATGQRENGCAIIMCKQIIFMEQLFNLF